MECLVFGSEAASFRHDLLVYCAFDSLNEQEQQWACLQLCNVYADQMKFARPKGAGDPLLNFVSAHLSMDGIELLIFVNEHGGSRGANPELLTLVRNAELLLNAKVLRDAMYCMMVAKLHAELQRLIAYGDLTKEFLARVTGMCKLYSMDVKTVNFGAILASWPFDVKVQNSCFMFRCL